MKRVKKKLMPRIIAVCLMLVMALSMGMAVSAAPPPLTPGAKNSITISGIETDDSGHGIGTLNAYRVINVNVNNNQPQAPVYIWNGAVAEWVSRNFRSYIDINNSNAVTDAFLDLSDQSDDEAQAELKTFVDRLANAIRYTEGEDTAITITPSYEIDLSQQVPTKVEKAITAEVSLGAYLFLVEGGVRIYSPGFAAVYPSNENGSWVTAGHKVDVEAKSEAPGIDKTVSDYTYEIGQTVTYTLTVDVPDYPDNAVNKKFIIADYLSNGLTLDRNSIKFYNYSDAAKDHKGDDITASFTNYVFGADDEHPAEGTSPSFAKSFTGDYSILASQVIVEYNATVNENAVVMEPQETENGLDNKVYLIYNNNPYTNNGYAEIPDEERVYTYGIQVTKTGDGNEKLPGAEFTLKPEGGSELQFIQEDDGVYRRPLSTDGSSVARTTTLVTDSNGLIQIRGLDLGTYILTETKAPEDYQLPADPTTEIVLADDADASGKPDGILNNDNDTDGTYEATVVNTKPGTLPRTGGIGTAVFTVCGILLMAGAVLLMVVVSRRKNR